MSIPFTQFLMPDGRQEHVIISRPPEIEAMAKALIEKGWRFEIEMLMTGDISMEVIKHTPRKDHVIAGEICVNGPPVPIAVDKMIQDATNRLCKTKPKKNQSPSKAPEDPKADTATPQASVSRE